MRRNITMLVAAFCCATASAQRVDFNLSGKEAQSLEDGYASWCVGRSHDAEQTFKDDNGNTVTIKIESVAETVGNAVFCNWWKDGVTRYSKLVSDALYPIILDDSNNYTWAKDKPMGIQLTISGLADGEHTLAAYHNNTDGTMSPGYPALKAIVDGVEKASGVEQTIRAQRPDDSGMSYVRFTVKDGKPVTVRYISQPEKGKEYINCSVAVNALIFDRPNPRTQAASPYPAHLDMHADADGGSVTLVWKGGSAAVRHHVVFGTARDMMKEVAVTDRMEYTVSGLTNLEQYFWRIDEEDADGNIDEGETWTFRPRHLAFPGAEGYGRFAIGGRGGIVYHVTSLDDDPDNPQPGTLRYGLREIHEPRTVVFDVSGYIDLKARLMCSDKYVTIAGQTAPGKGIILRGAPMGMNSDGITRFMRIQRGYAATEEEQNRGLDGLGIAGGDHAIMDHCSIAWTIDEGFSSRGAKSITLQRTMISEALNVADHPNYGSGTKHGYAATIGGGQGSGVGSFHHNLLAHCEGRNWSLSGGLTGGGEYDGAHDVFNNVVYNWGSRATDGGTHELNFVNNYYRMGEATSQKYLLRLQLEGTGKGTQSAFVSGNIREEKDGKIVQDKQGATYKYELSGGQKLDWQPFVSKAFFPSYATVETAEQALRTVLSDVGASLPVITDHDRRIISETRDKTYKYKGSKTGKKGLIDREEDAGGYEALPVERRSAAYDSDLDGMADWWERLNGLDPAVADNNSDNDGDGYTALEEFLNWMALPHYEIKGGVRSDIPLSGLFAGFSQKAAFSVESVTGGCTASVDGAVLSVVAPGEEVLADVMVKCSEGNYSMMRRINLRITGSATGIEAVGEAESKTSVLYNPAGQRVDNPKKGQVTITRGKKYILK